MINPEPLMFIDSAKKEEPIKSINQDVLLKIDGVIELYQKIKPVVCDIITKNSSYQGIPYNKDEEYLYIKQNGLDVTLKLEDIEEINILRI